MATTYLFDTTLFIDCIRKDLQAARWIANVARKNILAGVSEITIVELWIGLKNPEDEYSYKLLVAPFRQFTLNRKIAIRTAELWRPHHKSGAKISDFLIAATAEYYRADIVTHNVKHFEPLGLKNIRIINSHN